MLAAGCSSLIGGKAADTLAAAILNQDDPALVESGVPAYLLLIDGLISQSPDNVALLSAGAQLFALYGSRFSTPERAVTLTAKARRYGERAICLAHEPACRWLGADYARFVAELEAVGEKDLDALYSYARELVEPSRRDERGLDGRRGASVGRSGSRARSRARRDVRGRCVARLSRHSEFACGRRRSAASQRLRASISSGQWSSRAVEISRSR